MIHYTNCPVCNSPKVAVFLTAKDHTVSGEEFEIWECENCSLRFTQNAPAAENIGRYYQSENYVSHTDTSKGIVNKLYHRVRKITLGQKRQLIEKYTGLKKGNLLDIGAGTGAFLSEMKQAGWNVKGLEPDENARAVARSNYDLVLDPSQNLTELLNGSFDAITLWHVLEHVHDIKGYLAEIHGLLKADGVLFIAVPNYTSDDAKKYGSMWAAYDVPRHLYHFSARAMKTLLKRSLFQLVQIIPMKYDSYYVSLLSEKNRNSFLALARGGWSGFLSNLGAGKENYSSLIYVVKKQVANA